MSNCIEIPIPLPTFWTSIIPIESRRWWLFWRVEYREVYYAAYRSMTGERFIVSADTHADAAIELGRLVTKVWDMNRN